MLKSYLTLTFEVIDYHTAQLSNAETALTIIQSYEPY